MEFAFTLVAMVNYSQVPDLCSINQASTHETGKNSISDLDKIRRLCHCGCYMRVEINECKVMSFALELKTMLVIAGSVLYCRLKEA